MAKWIVLGVSCLVVVGGSAFGYGYYLGHPEVLGNARAALEKMFTSEPTPRPPTQEQLATQERERLQREEQREKAIQSERLAKELGDIGTFPTRCQEACERRLLGDVSPQRVALMRQLAGGLGFCDIDPLLTRALENYRVCRLGGGSGSSCRQLFSTLPSLTRSACPSVESPNWDRLADLIDQKLGLPTGETNSGHSGGSGNVRGEPPERSSDGSVPLTAAEKAIIPPEMEAAISKAIFPMLDPETGLLPAPVEVFGGRKFAVGWKGQLCETSLRTYAVSVHGKSLILAAPDLRAPDERNSEDPPPETPGKEHCLSARCKVCAQGYGLLALVDVGEPKPRVVAISDALDSDLAEDESEVVVPFELDGSVFFGVKSEGGSNWSLMSYLKLWRLDGNRLKPTMTLETDRYGEAADPDGKLEGVDCVCVNVRITAGGLAVTSNSGSLRREESSGNFDIDENWDRCPHRVTKRQKATYAWTGNKFVCRGATCSESWLNTAKGKGR